MADNQHTNDVGPKPDILDFHVEDQSHSIIKVIGVGGGGGNAVNHMYREGIHDVSFVLCNTDSKALSDSPVPVHIQLGSEGLGAGNKPEKAREAANESIDAIKNMLNDGTKMAFVTAGMGGGTGTGAAPVIAQVSKDMGILTVGIVTIPFRFEGDKKIDQALDGVEEMAKHVDALLVINNERLREIYPDLSVLDAFAKADDTLSVAAKSIAEIITTHGIINLDFNDVKTVLKDGGVAIMSTGYGEGKSRVKHPIEDALNSPLLNDNDVYHSKKILLSITFNSGDGQKGLMMSEMNDLNDFMAKLGDNFEMKWGVATDSSLGDKVKITILATGFGVKDVEPKEAHERRVEEDAKHTAELKAIERQRKNRRQSYYSESFHKKGLREPNPFIFPDEDLDNDDLIMAVENKPAYMRDSQTIRSFYELTSRNRMPQDKKDESKNTDEVHLISFT